MNITLYTPVIGPVSGDGSWSSLTHFKGPERDKAVTSANGIRVVRSGLYEIKRVEEEQVNDYEYYKQKV